METPELIEQLIKSFQVKSLLNDKKQGDVINGRFGDVLPYLPGALSLRCLVRWDQEVLKAYLDDFVLANQRQPEIWPARNEKESRVSILTSESRQTLSAVTQFIHRLTGSGLNVLFNIAVISILIDRRFALAYAISSVCSAILYKFMLRQQTELATHAQTTRMDLTRTLLSVWDNVVLGNRYNLRLWKKNADQDFDQASASAIRLSDFNQVMSVSIALVTLLPSVAVVILSALAHQTDRVALAALVVTLPRLFMILNYTYEVLVLGSEWNEHKAKISGVVAALKPGRQDLLSRIQWSKIRLERDGQSIIPKDWAHVIAFLSEKGRVTIRGENGAGKSSLLVSLKDHAGEDGFYLPAHHGLSFVSTARAQASTGQTLRMNLTEIATSVEANLILLDEWSANLDAESQKTLSRLVDQVASKKCVVEVIHSSRVELIVGRIAGRHPYPMARSESVDTN